MRCNKCGKEFSVETHPGALMFGHPSNSSISPTSIVWKAHLCQECEKIIIDDWELKPSNSFISIERVEGVEGSDELEEASGNNPLYRMV